MSDFHSLVDHTRFELVRRLVNRACSPVTDVLFVESDELLCEMAEVLTSPVNPARRRRIQRWFEEGRFAVGRSAARHGPSPADGQFLDVHSIDQDARCDVLYLPPYYLVYLAGGSVASRARSG